jgi:hypothetical protein
VRSIQLIAMSPRLVGGIAVHFWSARDAIGVVQV